MKLIDEILDALSLMTARHFREQVASAERKAMHVGDLRRQAAEKIWETERAKTRKDLAESAKAEAEKSYRKGFSEGREFERQEAVRIAREAQEEAERREREAAAERARWVVSSEPLGFDERTRRDIIADVAARPGSPPEPDQWKMILANDPATYVIAGAGSGKSTSLVLRVIALNLYKGIDRSQISVFTFTKDSRKDFIKKLTDRMAQWGVELSETDAKNVVRTFHSMVLRMARTSMSPTPRVLELIDRERKVPLRDIDVENLLEASEGDVPAEEADGAEIRDGKVGQAADSAEAGAAPHSDDDRDPHTVDDLLRLAYEGALEGSDRFYELVLRLFKLSLTQPRRATDNSTQGNVGRVAKIDRRLTEALDLKWRTEIAPGIWPLPGIEASVAPVSLSSQIAQEFWVNGYSPQIEAYVVLGGPDFHKGAGRDEIPSAQAIYTKRKLLAGISEKPLIWIDTVEELTMLRSKLKWLAGGVERRAEALMFKLVPPGEFEPKTITKAFYSLAQFVENIGLPVSETLESAEGPASRELRHETAFMEATAIFWRHFEQILDDQGIWTFNQLFARFSEDQPENFSAVPSHVLGAMRHLLIDEFQDISPQIVKWIRGCQKELVRRGLAGSLTCVGDDWQSIYGWRGSSPEFFVKFREHFPAISHGRVLLEDNFRSSDMILRCSESVLAGVPGMEEKRCRAKGYWANAEAPVRIVETKSELPYDEIRQHISSEILRTNATEEHPMLVLSRSRKAHRPLSDSPDGAWGKSVKFMTIHGSKGLESQSVALLGDCHYSGFNPLKNFLYSKARLGSYDEAQRAESRRVAYVGITRAMESCTWYAKKWDNGAIGNIPQGKGFATTEFR